MSDICLPQTVWCFYLQAGEAVALVAGQFCVDEFSEEKLSELWTLNTSGTRVITTLVYLFCI